MNGLLFPASWIHIWFWKVENCMFRFCSNDKLPPKLWNFCSCFLYVSCPLTLSDTQMGMLQNVHASGAGEGWFSWQNNVVEGFVMGNPELLHWLWRYLMYIRNVVTNMLMIVVSEMLRLYPVVGELACKHIPAWLTDLASMTLVAVKMNKGHRLKWGARAVPLINCPFCSEVINPDDFTDIL